MDITRRHGDKWVVDFGCDADVEAASLYEVPFTHVLTHVKPERDKTRRDKYRNIWWLFAEPIPGLRRALESVDRYVATPAVAKHRVFAWLSTTVVPDHALMAIARADDTTFGILHSHFHELWSLRMCTWLGVGNVPALHPDHLLRDLSLPRRPDAGRHRAPADRNAARRRRIPAGLAAGTGRKFKPKSASGLSRAGAGSYQTRSKSGRRGRGLAVAAAAPAAPTGAALRQHAVAIAEAAHRLDALRQNWLNPPEWTQRVPEVVCWAWTIRRTPTASCPEPA